jgi:hypothetical protein
VFCRTAVRHTDGRVSRVGGPARRPAMGSRRQARCRTELRARACRAAVGGWVVGGWHHSAYAAALPFSVVTFRRLFNTPPIRTTHRPGPPAAQLHSGLENPRHVGFNKVASSYHYSGRWGGGRLGGVLRARRYGRGSARWSCHSYIPPCRTLSYTVVPSDSRGGSRMRVGMHVLCTAPVSPAESGGRYGTKVALDGRPMSYLPPR